MDGRGDVGWVDFVHEERLAEDGAYWQWGDVRGEEVDSTYTEGVCRLTGECRAVLEPPLREGRGMGEGQEVLEGEG